MGVSVRLSRNTRVYVPWAVAIPVYLAYLVFAVLYTLWFLLVILPIKGVKAWRASRL